MAVPDTIKKAIEDLALDQALSAIGAPDSSVERKLMTIILPQK